MCEKQGYETEFYAQWALDIAKEKAKTDPTRKECRYYYCIRCFQFHLTSQPYDETRRRNKNHAIARN